MPAFTFTSPDGKQYTVNGPVGSTKEQAFAILQGQLSTAQQAPTAANIPVSAAEQAFAAQQTTPTPTPSAPADPSLVDRLIGGGETALSLATGATTGAFGALGGALAGIGQSVANGTFGTQQGVQTAEQAAAEGANKFTYAPRGAEGQRQTEAYGNLINAAIPFAPLTAEMGALGRGAQAAGAAARDLAPVAAEAATGAAKQGVAATKAATGAVAGAAKSAAATTTDAAVSAIRNVSPKIADRVERTLSRNPEPSAPTPGTAASVGAAGTDLAEQRRQVAADLPVPIELTKGQAERSFEQQRFEREMAKEPSLGEPLRNRFAQQNEDIMKNFDSWVDQTGAEAPSLRAVGATVDQALVKKADRDKSAIRVAYKEADKAGELADPVQLDSLVEHLNDSAPDVATAPLLDVARKRALQLGIATEGADGQLVAAPVTLKTAETMRQAIGRATDYEATNIRQSSIIKGLIDSGTENAGGDLYRAARRLRENYAKQYEEHAVISKILNNKRGTSDRQVALEDIWNHSILKQSMDSVRHVRRVLQTGGEEGKQAWRELQGQTINWIKDEATKNVATDTRGNPIVSPDKLNKAIRTLDADGKLDFLFGKRGAQQLRDINDLSKVVLTSPPGTVNTSNTASVLLAALTEAGATGAFTGIPVPVLSSLRLISKQVKNRQIQKRIEQALSARTHTKPPPEVRPRGATLH